MFLARREAVGLQIKVKYLAVAREIAGVRQEVLELRNPSTVIDLLKAISNKHGARMHEYLFGSTGDPHSHLQFLLDDKSIHLMSGFETSLTDGSTLAIVPPVSGG